MLPGLVTLPFPCCATVGTLNIVPEFEGLASTLQSISLAHPDDLTQLCNSVRQAPPRFRGILFTSMADIDAPVLHAEIAVLLGKDATKMKLGFYSSYFIILKITGGL